MIPGALLSWGEVDAVVDEGECGDDDAAGAAVAVPQGMDSFEVVIPVDEVLGVGFEA